ncbi:MAG: hypothetical protein KF689_04100 [Gemmatimonadaceae bacterium]|nr:hypothetical protein [Gemmatimonadaceae bacterium]MCW5825637.1 hypothetical protein [Gemmatimonadaceae bacterium]
MFRSTLRVVPVLGLLALGVSACGDSTTGPGGEQELITRVTLTLTPTGGGAALTAYIDDPDGLGPIPPSAQVGDLNLVANGTYTGTILFENRLVAPPENITEEVEEEAEEHGIIYTVSGATGTTVVINDTDADGKFLGLQYTVTAGATPGPGTLRVVLCHYDDAPKPMTATSCAGDTDIDLTFNFTVVAATLQAARQ